MATQFRQQLTVGMLADHDPDFGAAVKMNGEQYVLMPDRIDISPLQVFSVRVHIFPQWEVAKSECPHPKAQPASSSQGERLYRRRMPNSHARLLALPAYLSSRYYLGSRFIGFTSQYRPIAGEDFDGGASEVNMVV